MISFNFMLTEYIMLLIFNYFCRQIGSIRKQKCYNTLMSNPGRYYKVIQFLNIMCCLFPVVIVMWLYGYKVVMIKLSDGQ